MSATKNPREHEGDVEPLVFIPQVHEERSNTVSLDDTHDDEDRPNDRSADCDFSTWNRLKEDRSDFEQCEHHQNDEVPKVNVFAHV